MGKPDRPVFHEVVVPGDVVPVRQWLQLAWALLGLAVLCPFFVPRWEAWAPMLLAVGCAAWIRRRMRGERLGYRLDEQGLTRVSARGRDEQTWPWESIRTVEPRLLELRVETDDGVLVFGHDLPTWPELGRQLKRGLIEHVAELARPLAPSKIEDWLALPRHGTLEVSSGPISVADVVAVLAAYVYVGLLITGKGTLSRLIPAAALPYLWAGLAVAALATVVAMARGNVRLTADAMGLLVRNGRHTHFYPWEQITGATLDSNREAPLLIETTHGTLSCPHPSKQARRLRHAIEQMQVAREDGALLPRDSGVPETALSVAEASAPVDRGLSRET